MKKNTFYKSAIMAILAGMLFSFDIPSGWIVGGSKPESYDMGIDKGAGRDGKNAGTIQSKAKKIKGFGTLMQLCMADSFLGKRVRMTGWVKTRDVKEWCGLWLRVDEKDCGEPYAFDNMHDRKITGTTEWKQYEIVLEVSNTASQLDFGALLSGTGQVWFDDMKFEVVDSSVPLTSASAPKREKKTENTEPVNLDFEK